jgi:hypothetical protein
MKPYYQDDYVTIYHGDSREVKEWLCGDVMVSDPPYGMAYTSGWQDRTIANDHDTSVRDEALAMWGDKPALIFGRWDCPHPKNARMMLTWSKGDWPGMGDLQLPWGPSTEEIYVLGRGFVGKRGGSVIACDRLTGAIAHPGERDHVARGEGHAAPGDRNRARGEVLRDRRAAHGAGGIGPYLSVGRSAFGVERFQMNLP